MKSLLCSTRLPSLITALGAAPLLIYAFWPPAQQLPELYAQVYAYSVISFIGGINWITALKNNNAVMLLWSILLSIVPLLLLILNYVHLLSVNQVWSAFIITLLLALAYDFKNRSPVGLPYYFCFRRAGTLVMIFAILCVILKN